MTTATTTQVAAPITTLPPLEVVELEILRITDFDPDAIYPNGHRTGPWGVLNDGAPLEEQVRGWRPPFPDYWTFDFPCRFRPNNLWAEICRNHGIQFSAEMIASVLPQLFGSGSGGSRFLSVDGEPVAVLNRVAANPDNFVICMTPAAGSGHCVTPFGVVHNARFREPDETPDRPGGLVSDPPAHDPERANGSARVAAQQVVLAIKDPRPCFRRLDLRFAQSV